MCHEIEFENARLQVKEDEKSAMLVELMEEVAECSLGQDLARAKYFLDSVTYNNTN